MCLTMLSKTPSVLGRGWRNLYLPSLFSCNGRPDYNSRILVMSCSNAPSVHVNYETIVKCLKNHGFDMVTCEHVFSKVSKYHLDESNLNLNLMTLAACQFGHEKLTHLLMSHPHLVILDHQQVMTTFTFLSSRFSSNFVYKIFMNSPGVLNQNSSDLTHKIDFLHKNGISNFQMVNSQTLSYAIDHLMVRLTFLKRCGLFTVPEKVAMDGSSPSRSTVNLSHLFDTTDEQFSTKTAGLSSAEYDVFKTLYSIEMEENSDCE